MLDKSGVSETVFDSCEFFGKQEARGGGEHFAKGHILTCRQTLEVALVDTQVFVRVCRQSSCLNGQPVMLPRSIYAQRGVCRHAKTAWLNYRGFPQALEV